jgi:hypothetical protein
MKLATNDGTGRKPGLAGRTLVTDRRRVEANGDARRRRDAKRAGDVAARLPGQLGDCVALAFVLVRQREGNAADAGCCRRRRCAGLPGGAARKAWRARRRRRRDRG